MRILLKFSSLILILFISACGFHLRGTEQSHAAISKIAIQYQGDASDNLNEERQRLQSTLLGLLQSQHTQLLSSDQDVLTLIVDPLQLQQEEVVVGSDVQHQKQVIISLNIPVSLHQDGDVLAKQLISSSHTLNYSQNNFLGNSEEAKEIRQQLIDECAEKIVNFVNSHTQQ